MQAAQSRATGSSSSCEEGISPALAADAVGIMGHMAEHTFNLPEVRARLLRDYFVQGPSLEEPRDVPALFTFLAGVT